MYVMSTRANRATAGAWVLVATLFAHTTGYWFTFQDEHSRQHALEATGHGWLGMLYPALIAAGLAAALGVLAAHEAALSRLHRFDSSVQVFLLISLLKSQNVFYTWGSLQISYTTSRQLRAGYR